ncbi:hypothetical protein B5F09_08170 [Erysipelatoclostridium sp. An173]|uniref:YczE/YyaS/YitT family protein n=1 Tax=unclassified Thomasclavelia TaxID=3025756 RepID=UPI000B395266|nr:MULTISPECIES: DUF6198 family protein [unclassified Thomasclavelia]OUP76655.1 hypothetical protein B5F09_08170 [Erysipelatoclostridium sp. An173]
MIKRFIVFVVGMNVLAIGIILNTKSLLGVGSINTLPYALANILSVSLGTMTTMVYLVFIIIQLILLKRFDLQVIIQLPFSFIFGYLIDFYDLFFSYEPTAFYMQIVILIIAIVLTALGAFLMVLGDIVLNPADGLVHTIGKVTNKDFGFVKNIADLVFIVLTVVICLVTKGYILGIGIGTVVSAIFIGRFVALYQNIYNHLQESKI